MANLDTKKTVVITKDALNKNGADKTMMTNDNLRCVEFKDKYVIYKSLSEIETMSDLIKKLKEIKNGVGKKFSIHKEDNESTTKKIFIKPILNNETTSWLTNLAEPSDTTTEKKIQSENQFLTASARCTIKLNINHNDLINHGPELIKAYSLVATCEKEHNSMTKK